MKSKFFSVFGLLLASTAALAANKEVGNGGGAWVCREQSGTIRWAKFVDLFEAQSEFHYKIEDAHATPENEALFRFIKLKRYGARYAGAYYDALNEVNARINRVRDADLKVINDSLYRLQPSRFSCAGGALGYEQLANYTDDKRILLNQDIYEKLTPIEQAALLTHEAIYLVERKYHHATDSVISRKIVAGLYSRELVDLSDQVRQNYLFESDLEYKAPDFLKFDCGLTQASVEDRMQECSHIPGNVVGKWALVARKYLKDRSLLFNTRYEVWKHLPTGRLWSRGSEFVEKAEAATYCKNAPETLGIPGVDFRLPTPTEVKEATEKGLGLLRGERENSLTCWASEPDGRLFGIYVKKYEVEAEDYEGPREVRCVSN